MEKCAREKYLRQVFQFGTHIALYVKCSKMGLYISSVATRQFTRKVPQHVLFLSADAKFWTMHAQTNLRTDSNTVLSEYLIKSH